MEGRVLKLGVGASCCHGFETQTVNAKGAVGSFTQTAYPSAKDVVFGERLIRVARPFSKSVPETQEVSSPVFTELGIAPPRIAA
jgi:hypothetical protein